MKKQVTFDQDGISRSDLEPTMTKLTVLIATSNRKGSVSGLYCIE